MTTVTVGPGVWNDLPVRGAVAPGLTAQAAPRPSPSWGSARPRPRSWIASAILHGIAIGGWIAFTPHGSPPVEHPRVGLIRVLGGVPVEPVQDEQPPREPIHVEFVPPPVDVLPEPLIEPLPFVEPTVEVRPAPDARSDPLQPPLPDRAWTDRMRPEPVPEEPVEPAPDEPAPEPPRSDAGQLVEPMPIDELNTPPRYPPRAIQLHLQGRVTLRVVVDARGRVLRCSVFRSSGFDILDRAALDAVRSWVFRDGPGEIDLPIDFILHSRGT